MKQSDPRTRAGLSDLEAPLSIHPGNGDIVASDLDEQQDPRLPGSWEQAIANIRLLWESRRFLARVTAAGFLLSVALALLIPKRYESVARLMPPDNQSGTGGLAMAAAALSGGGGALGGLGGMASELMGLKSNSDLLVGVLGSRTVQNALVEKFDLRKVYRVARIEDARKRLSSLTDISVDRKSQIIVIKVTDTSPERAAAIAQAYTEELNRTVAEVSTSSARRERIFLEGRLQGVSKDLEASEKEFGQFASKNTAIDIKEQGKAMVDAAATLQGQMIAALSELEGLRQIYADGNVRVRSSEARVAELKDQLKKVGGNDESASLDSGGQSESLYPSIRKLPLLGVPYADLYRKTKVEEAVFETLTQEYELAKVQEAKEIPTVKVLDPPNVPERKSFPPRSLIVLLGAFLAFACGVTWLFVIGMWQQTDPSDPAKALAQEVFDSVKSSIPWISRNGYASGADREASAKRSNSTELGRNVSK
jgi:uncharacterized protein involved in exopolysaccharide biosynthesis